MRKLAKFASINEANSAVEVRQLSATKVDMGRVGLFSYTNDRERAAAWSVARECISVHGLVAA